MIDVLLVDQEREDRALLEGALRAEGYRVDSVCDVAEAANRLAQRSFDVVVSDVAPPATAAALPCRRIGRPLDLDGLLDELRTIASARQAEHPGALRGEGEGSGRARASEATLIGRSPMIMALRRRIDLIARSSCSALIVGESGTGKELVARMIHERSPRRDRPFVVVNCAAIPDTLFDAEFFGHEKGAFTGAVRRHAGHFEVADQGTLLLDEIGELSAAGQAKLLRVLQDGGFQRIGGTRPLHADVRVLAATNRDLGQMILQGQFREDLLYRLNVVTLEVPPLRHRRGDLSLLVAHFIETLREPGGRCPSITSSAWAALRGYPYPGNVRELEHMIHHALIMSSGGDVDLEDLPAAVQSSSPDLGVTPPGALTLHQAVAEFEREYIRRVLDTVGGSRTRAAEVLGISRKTLWEKMRSLPGGRLTGAARARKARGPAS